MYQFTEESEKDFSPDRESLPYIQLQPAVENKSASFGQLFSAHYGAYFTTDRQEARTYHYYYKQLLPAFEEQNGRIVEQFHAPCPASAYLTEKDAKDGKEFRLYIDFWPGHLDFDSLPAQALLGQIVDLRDEALQYLAAVDQRRLLLQKLFAVATSLIATIASEWMRHTTAPHRIITMIASEWMRLAKKPHRITTMIGSEWIRRTKAPHGIQPSTDQFKKGIDHLNERLEEVRRFYVECATKGAQIHYFVGMAIATVLILSTTAVLTLATSLPNVALAVVASGAAGAFVSVASRVTIGTPVVAYKETPRRLEAFGALRPVVGSLLSGAVCAVIAAGLVPAVNIQPEPRELLVSFSALAFVAGFSERFAQDVLLRTSPGTSR